MAKFFKKIGKGIKKFAKSKVGKVVGIVAGVGATAVGAGFAIKGIKAAKAAKALVAANKAKGLLSKGKSALKKAKGIGGSAVISEKENKALFGGGIDRLAKKIKKKSSKQQSKIDKKQAKLDGKQDNLDKSLMAAQEALGSGGAMNEETDDKGWLEEQLDRVKGLKKLRDSDVDDSSAPLPASSEGMTTGAKVATGAALLAGGYGVGKLLGFIR
jgi:type IV secretory pathway TrbL component